MMRLAGIAVLVSLLALIVGGAVILPVPARQQSDTPTTAATQTTTEQRATTPSALAERAPTSSEWPEAHDGATLQLDCVHAQDGERALVGGTITRQGQVVQGCLFRTRDGGRSWQPVAPQLPGLRVLAVHERGEQLWALAQAEGVGALAPRVLQFDPRLGWRQQDLRLGAYPGRQVAAADFAFVAQGAGCMQLGFRERPGEYARLISDRSGMNWRFDHARPGEHDSLRRGGKEVQSSNGWAWRVQDGIIERRRPRSEGWRPTYDQPLDRYESPEPEPYIAGLF